MYNEPCVKCSRPKIQLIDILWKNTNISNVYKLFIENQNSLYTA